MSKNNKFSPEVRERAVRLVQEHRGEYPWQWAAVQSIAPKLRHSFSTFCHFWSVREILGCRYRFLTISVIHESSGGDTCLL